MRTKIALALLGICALVGAYTLDDPGPMRYEKLDESRSIVYVENGAPVGEIVVAKGEGPKFAAEELQQFIERSTGAKLPIVAQPTGKPAFIIGIAPDGFDVATLPRDGFIIRTVGDNTYIVGQDEAEFSPVSRRSVSGHYYKRGTLFGVYGFLERFLGARLVLPIPECEYVRTMKSLTLPAIDLYDRPDNTMRSYSWSHAWKDLEKARINMARLRYQTDTVPNCHGLGRLGYVERFGKEHPEYFALRKNGTRSNNLAEKHTGQLCYSSGIVEEIYKDVKAYLTGVSAEERGVYIDRFKKCVWDWNAAWRDYYVNVMPQDGMVPCQCEKCQAEMAKNPQWASDVVWKMTVDFDKRLKAEGIKGEVTQMAYGLLMNIPPFDIPDTVPVMVAVFGPWGERMGQSAVFTGSSKPRGFDSQLEKVAAWHKKLNHKVWLWTYIDKYSGRNILGVPCSTPRAVGHFLKQVQKDIHGSYGESETDRVSYQALNHYVHCQMLWNSSLDPDKLVDDLCRDFFGEGASEMNAFFQLVEDLWLEKICANCVMTERGPEQAAPSERALWTEIYSPAVIAKMQAHVDAAKSAVKGDKAQLASIAYWEREFIGTLKAEADKFHASQRSLELMDTFVPEGTPVLTGKLDDKVWGTGALLKLRPQKNAPVEVQTEVRLLHDAENIYVGVKCDEPRMAERYIYPLKHDDSEVWKTDSIELFFDAGVTRREYVQIMLNTMDAYCDIKIDKPVKKYDTDFESNAKVKYNLGEDGWTMEVAVPLASIGNARKYGFDISRSRVIKDDNKPARYHQWSPFAKGYGDVANFGVITFDKVESDNLVENPTFAAKQNGRWCGKWFCTPALHEAGKVSYDDTVFMFSGKSMKLESKAGLEYADWTMAGQYLTGIKPNTKYRMTAYLKIDNKKPGSAGGVFFMFNDGVNQGLPKAGSIKESMPWTAFTFEVTTRPEIGDKPYIRVISTIEGTAWLDGVMLQEIK